VLKPVESPGKTRRPYGSQTTRRHPIAKRPRSNVNGLAFCHGGTRNATIMLADRAVHGTPFGNYQTVVVDGQPLTGRAPRYLPVSQTLYLSRDADPAVKDSEIYVVSGVPASPAAGK
jgi:hypothetical protein